MSYNPNNPNGQGTMANSAPVVIASNQSNVPIATVDTTSSGSITAAAQTVSLALNGQSGVAIQLTGTWVGTFQFEGTVDGTNWIPMNGVFAGSSTPTQTTTTNGIIRVTPSGLAQVRINATAWTSGTAAVSLRASSATGGTFLNQSLTAGTNSIGSVKLPDVATAGSLAALNAVVVTAVNSQGIVAIQLSGTWVGTISFKGTEDPLGVTAPAASFFPVNGVASVSGAQVTSAVANGQFRVNAGGYTAVQTIMTAFTSGSATVWLNASLAPSMATLAEPLPVGTNIIGALTANQSVNNTQINGVARDVGAGNKSAGTPRMTIATDDTNISAIVTNTSNTATSAAQTNGTQQTKITDGTNIATIKAASTAVVAADKAIVVAISPNAVTAVSLATNTPTLQTGTNAIGSVNTLDQISTAISIAATATTGGSITTLNSASTATLQLTGTWVGALTFQTTVDGTNWISIVGNTSVTSIGTTIGYVTGGSITTVGIYQLDISGCSGVRIITTSYTSGTITGIMRTSLGNSSMFLDAPLPAGTNAIGSLTANQSVNSTQVNGVTRATGNGVSGTGVIRVAIASDQTAFSVNTTTLAPSATYAATAPNMATAALATDFFTLTGSATKTVSLKKITINGVQTTGGQISILIIRRSTANTGGTFTTIVSSPMDTANAAATATVLAYTANPTTVGTVVANIQSDRIFLPGAATASDAQGLSYAFGDSGQQMQILRGVAQTLAINLVGATVTGGSINVNIEWQEA